MKSSGYPVTTTLASGARARIACTAAATFAATVAGLLIGGAVGQRARAVGVLERARSFYGAYTVRATATYHHLQHGNTLHGAQDTRPAYRTTPLTYYHAGSPLGGLFARVPRLAPGAPPRRVAAARPRRRTSRTARTWASAAA